MSMPSESLLELPRSTMNAAPFCFLITQDESGQSTARLMQPFGPEPELTLWFGTSPTSHKVQAVLRNERVTLTFAHPPDGAYVTLSGLASLERDGVKRQHYWRPEFAAFWPTGPTGVAPAPYGLRPVTLDRTGAGWVMID